MPKVDNVKVLSWNFGGVGETRIAAEKFPQADKGLARLE